VILTVTPNPSLDLLFVADRLLWDDANRMAEPRRRPGGQGINAVRAARRLGGEALAVALLGGDTGNEIRDTLVDEGTPIEAVRAATATRLFIATYDRSRKKSLLLNARGPARSMEDAEHLLAAAGDAILRHQPAWVAGCGSLPPGFPDDFYVHLARVAKDTGARFVADCDGPALRTVAPLCDLLVPNAHEAGRLLGRTVRRKEGAASAAAELLATGPGTVAITLGPRGAVLAAGSRTWFAAPPPTDGTSAVGAGDAFLAALLLGLEAGDDPPVALIAATAAGASVLESEGAAILDPGTFRRIRDATTVSVVQVA
jgi:1-phosphofructokinase family hexose kinase